MDRSTITLVFRKLRIAKRMIEVIAERRAHGGVAVELNDRLAKRLRKRADTAFATIALV
jgi:hypothetical protein